MKQRAILGNVARQVLSPVGQIYLLLIMFTRVSQKTFFSSIILAVESLVRMGDLSHQKKFQNYRPINDP